MPGHKGVAGPLGVEPRDITEIDGADVLAEAAGIIGQSEANASELFGCPTYYSAEGSSLCIRAMIYLVRKWAVHTNRKPLILAGRNAHKAFLSAAALTGTDVEWIMPRETDSYEVCRVTPEDVRTYLEAGKEKPAAVYVTSPDYLGNQTDIKALAKYLHSQDVLLLADGAHGAYLHFLTPQTHPMDLGADLCCDSAHKTLPVLTGGAYLHLANGRDPYFSENVRAAMALFASSSPSYLILQSLDLCNAFLAGSREEFARVSGRTKCLRERIEQLGFTVAGDEPWKITVCVSDGDFLADKLAERGVIVEYHDADHVVMMFSAGTSDEDCAKTAGAMEEIANSTCVEIKKIKRFECDCASAAQGKMPANGSRRMPVPERIMTPAEAILCETETVPAAESVGRILAEACVHCPPCVPPYMPGEIIGSDITHFTKDEVRVVKDTAVKPVQNTEGFGLTEEYLKCLGRTYLTDTGLWLSYSASGAEWEFTGTRCVVRLLGDELLYADEFHSPRYAIYVDGVELVTAVLRPSKRTAVTVVDCEKPERHIVRVIKLSETADSVMAIEAVTGEGTMKPTPRKALAIEFIGDSITCGYGVDGALGELYRTANENASKSYAYRTAAKLDADYSMVSFSGYGLVSGYTDTGVIRPECVVQPYYETMGVSYGAYAGGGKPESVAWDFARFTPDFVVINLGTNDASYCGEDPAKQQVYVDAYKVFLATVRSHNVKAAIVCTLGTMDQRLCASMERAVSEYRAQSGDTNVYSMRFAPLQAETEGIGVDYHPSPRTHERDAEQLAEFLRKLCR